ncbi:MAG TPA: hypothetical protein VH372_13495 [Actinospica sp.]|jgi:hypothetical protein|nr:hypothetical protein [Actinospica sp.]
MTEAAGAKPGQRWQALLVGVASSADGDDRSFAQSLDSQVEFARAIERNMPGLAEDDLIVLPEPWYGREVTDRIAELNEAHDADARAGRPRPGLLFYYCGHGMAHEDGRLYLSTVATIDDDRSRGRTGLALAEVLQTAHATAWRRPRVVCILDCCFAGLAVQDPAAERAHLLMAVARDVVATHDPYAPGPTHFTAALVHVLQQGVAGAGEWIDLDTLHREAVARLVAEHGEARRPYQRAYRDSGTLPIGVNRQAWVHDER